MTTTVSAVSSQAERMAKLRQLVADEKIPVEDAARKVGVDPLIAQLWVRLPDDLWPAQKPPDSSTAADLPMPPPPPMNGLHRVLTCRIPTPAFDRLRTDETPILEAAVAALQAGIAQPRPKTATGGSRYPRRPLAVPMPADEYTAVLQLAQENFDGNPHEAAGWLIARGLGMVLPLPTRDELDEAARLKATTQQAEKPPTTTARFTPPSRRRPEPRAPLPPNDSAPNGEELRQQRDALGISQRDLAGATGLSRGLIAGIERGHRRHILTRIRIAETLASLERDKRDKKGG